MTVLGLLDVNQLKTYFFTEAGVVKAVDNVSFSVESGEALGLAGESGCGKSTTAYSIMRLVPHPGKIVGGSITLDGVDVTRLSDDEVRRLRWKKVAMVFQGAMNALNPVIRVGDQIVEGIVRHNEGMSSEEARELTKELFKKVGLDPGRVNDYPHQFSGGMKQRAMIAMALANNPDLLLLDEPTTALDVTTQAQILDLISQLREEYKMGLVLISHDLSIIAETCDRVAIMYAGKIVEQGTVDEIFKDPIHPYTKGLVEAIPYIGKSYKGKLFSIPGDPPTLVSPPSGCRFHPRCVYAKDVCKVEEPGVNIPGRGLVACHFAEELKGISPRKFWGAE